jgi:hypothetical protein
MNNDLCRLSLDTPLLEPITTPIAIIVAAEAAEDGDNLREIQFK